MINIVLNSKLKLNIKLKRLDNNLLNILMNFYNQMLKIMINFMNSIKRKNLILIKIQKIFYKILVIILKIKQNNYYLKNQIDYIMIKYFKIGIIII